MHFVMLDALSISFFYKTNDRNVEIKMIMEHKIDDAKSKQFEDLT